MPKRSIIANKNDEKLTYFTDREEIVKVFREFLSPAQNSDSLFAMKGDPGTGKTFLISYLTKRVCPKLSWHSGRINFTQSTSDFRTILLRLEDALKGSVSLASLEQFRAKRDEYNRSFDDYKAPSDIGSIKQTMKAKSGASIPGSSQSIQIRFELRERELQLRSEWSRALVELSEKMECPLCLFIDGFERLIETNSELFKWFFGDVLFPLTEASSQPLRVVTCGWEYPDEIEVEPFNIDRAKLDHFDARWVNKYLQKRRVLDSIRTCSAQEQQELVDTFYKLTYGHPLVLNLAVTYFYELPIDQRTAKSLQTKRHLIDARAGTEFFGKRLLKRLREPYYTLLKWGPILRSFDQLTLQALLEANPKSTSDGLSGLDDESYEHFIQYPFISRKSESSNEFSFHSLVRQVWLNILRQHPQTKERLHRKMANFYMKNADAEQKDEPNAVGLGFNSNNAEKLVKMPEENFGALLEWFYHTLQVKKLQIDAFQAWEVLIERAVNTWLPQRAEMLLDLVLQLNKEGEPFLRETSDSYQQYLIWYDRFLEQQVTRRISSDWELASALPLPSTSFDALYGSQVETTSLPFKEQLDYSTDIAPFLGNIDSFYASQELLLSAYQLFEEEPDIGPGQCEYIITHLHRTGELVQGSLQLLETPVRLPKPVALLRYPLAMSLRQMDQQVRELVPLMTRFCAICLTKSAQVADLRQEIRLRLESIIRNHDDILASTNTLREEGIPKEKYGNP